MDASSALYFPSELVDHIVASIPKRQVKTLLACTLVCRQWYLVTRRHLFHTVKARLREPEKSATHLAQFLEANPEIARYIYNLTLCAQRGQENSWPSISSRSLSLILSHLPVLDSLALRQLRVENGAGTSAEPRRIGSLTFEQLYCTRMPHSGDILDMLGLFSYVGSLRIHSLHFEPNIADVRVPVHGVPQPQWHMRRVDLVDARLRTALPALRVESLAVDRQSRTYACLRLLRLSGSVETLTKVFVHCTTSMDLTSLAQLVNSIGARLRTLIIQILWLDERWPHENVAAHLENAYRVLARALQQCTGVTSFVLYQWMHTTNSPAIPCQRIVHLVNSLPATLSHLRIDLDDEISNGWDYFDADTWRALRLAIRRLGSLRSLELTANGIEGDSQMRDDCRAMIREEMEEFHSLGILHLPA